MSPKHSGKLAFLFVCCLIAQAPIIKGYSFASMLMESSYEGFRRLASSREVLKQPEYLLSFREGPKKDKEVVVVVFITSAPGIGPEFKGAEGKLASDIAKKFPELANENKQKLAVLDPAEVNQFKMKNPDWNRMHPSQWGKELGADFVLDIHLEKMSLYQPGSLNQLYEGRAEVTVDVYDVDAGLGEPKYNYVHPFEFPKTNVNVLDLPLNCPVNRFKQAFLERLAAELAMKHVEHKEGTGIANAK